MFNEQIVDVSAGRQALNLLAVLLYSGVNVVVATALAVVVVQAGHGVSNAEGLVKLTICQELHDVLHVVLDVSREAGGRGLLAVMIESAVEAEPESTNSAKVPLHELGVVVVGGLVAA